MGRGRQVSNRIVCKFGCKHESYVFQRWVCDRIPIWEHVDLG
jgi:hypothetical protein